MNGIGVKLRILKKKLPSFFVVVTIMFGGFLIQNHPLYRDCKGSATVLARCNAPLKCSTNLHRNFVGGVSNPDTRSN